MFDHSNSVFRDWKPDTPASLEKMLEHDYTHWKAARFCKDPEELERVKRVVRLNIEFIKKVFHFLISKSLYPGIGWLDFGNWTAVLKVADGARVQQHTIDRTFVAANVELVKIEGNDSNENALNRF